MPFLELESGIIHLDAGIDYENAIVFLSTFRQMELSSKNSEIVVHITSHGGQLMPALAIVQAIRVCSKRVITIGTGYVASAAVPVLAAGHHRRMVEGTKLLIHQPTNGLAGVSRKDPSVETWREEIETLDELVNGYWWALEICTGRNASFWKDMLRNKTSAIVNVDEAVQHGLIDEIINVRRQASLSAPV